MRARSCGWWTRDDVRGRGGERFCRCEEDSEGKGRRVARERVQRRATTQLCRPFGKRKKKGGNDNEMMMVGPPRTTARSVGWADAPRVLHGVRDDGVEAARELVPLPAARGLASSVPDVVPRVRRDARLGEAGVQPFEPPEVLVDAVRPHEHRAGGRRALGAPRPREDLRAAVRGAREQTVRDANHRTTPERSGGGKGANAR